VLEIKLDSVERILNFLSAIVSLGQFSRVEGALRAHKAITGKQGRLQAKLCGLEGGG